LCFFFLVGSIVRLTGVASARIYNDFQGELSSAYLLDRPILNAMQPTFALDELVNESNQFKIQLFVLILTIFAVFFNQF
jgi:hypothetical protein